MTMTLTEFLLARIAEDEAELGPFVGPDEGAGPNGIGWADVGAISHVLMSSQRRALAQVAAHRAIVEDHAYMAGHVSRDFGFEDGNCWTCRKQGPCLTLLHLAAVYAGHPDYREEWRP